MVVSIQEAYNILNLRSGATAKEVIGSFKKLAFECHPDKHSRSDKSYQQFFKICDAYRRLTVSDEKQISKPLSKETMFEMFQEVYIKSYSQQNGFSTSFSDDDDSDDDDISVPDFRFSTPRKTQIKKVFPDKKCELEKPVPITDEAAKKNADSLVAEEEKERKKAERRRAKKKRRKEKKKIEKVSGQTEDKKDSNNTNSQAHIKNKNADQSSSEDESDLDEELDPNSAFVATAFNKNKSANQNHIRSSKSEKLNMKDQKDLVESKESNITSVDDTDPTILQSRKLAIRGNEMANYENFQAAVELFSEAIKMNPKDFRFYGNRSFCFDKLCLFDKALKDAEKAIQLNPGWPKNYHRRGRALAGLKRYSEAEVAFEEVLKLDKDCEDAQQELNKVRTDQIVEMGFTVQQAQNALKRFSGSVQAALDSLLTGSYAAAATRQTAGNSEVYFSDDEGPSQALPKRVSHPVVQHFQQPADVKMDPRNPEGLTSLWIGNVSKDVAEKSMKQLFSKYGHVLSLRVISDKFCAFINYSDKTSASRAMAALQGVMFGGQNLLIRFPDKPFTNSNSLPSVLIKKPSSKNAVVPLSGSGAETTAAATAGPKVTGPVNGDECYFWRTTGCVYGNTCRFKHIPHSKGVDKKPWQTQQC